MEMADETMDWNKLDMDEADGRRGNMKKSMGNDGTDSDDDNAYEIWMVMKWMLPPAPCAPTGRACAPKTGAGPSVVIWRDLNPSPVYGVARVPRAGCAASYLGIQQQDHFLCFSRLRRPACHCIVHEGLRIERRVGISSTRETECTTKHCHCATSVAGNDAGLQTRARSYIHPTFLCPAFSTPPSAFNLTYNCLRTYHGPLSPLSPQSRPTRCTASVSGLLPSPTPDIRVRGNPPSLPSIRGMELGRGQPCWRPVRKLNCNMRGESKNENGAKTARRCCWGCVYGCGGHPACVMVNSITTTGLSRAERSGGDDAVEGLLLVAKVGRGSFAHSQTRAGPTAIPEVMVPACSVFRASFPSLQGQNILDSFVNDVCLAALASDVNTVNESTLVIYVDRTVVSVVFFPFPASLRFMCNTGIFKCKLWLWAFRFARDRCSVVVSLVVGRLWVPFLLSQFADVAIDTWLKQFAGKVGEVGPTKAEEDLLEGLGANCASSAAGSREGSEYDEDM
ncbi:hypothetical protein BJ912DRAFT_925374 [Pholiota molesta]|nr:hypothetical protein BJ912DRAFT_925374 [Pholiota molesta]